MPSIYFRGSVCKNGLSNESFRIVRAHRDPQHVAGVMEAYKIRHKKRKPVRENVWSDTSGRYQEVLVAMITGSECCPC